MIDEELERALEAGEEPYCYQGTPCGVEEFTYEYGEIRDNYVNEYCRNYDCPYHYKYYAGE